MAPVMEEQQDASEFARVSVKSSSAGPVIGIQKLDARSGGTINYSNVQVLSAELEHEKRQKALEDFTSTLRTKYEAPPLTTLSGVLDKPLDCVDLHLEEGGTSGRLGNWLKLKRFPDILKGTEAKPISGNILLIGPPGSGKTTLIWRTASDWAKGNFDVFRAYFALLVYSLKDLQPDKRLEEVITEQLESYFCTDFDVPWVTFLQEIKGRLILILDGYDELSENQKSKLHSFLGEKSPFFKSTKVVSTREYSGDEHIEQYFPKKVRILELEEPMLRKIVSGSCEVETVSQIIKFLSTNKNCTKLFKTSPLLIACLCFVYNAENTDLESVASICLQVIKKLFEKKVKNDQAIGNIDEFVKKLGEVSFKSLMNKNDHTLPLSSLQANDHDQASNQDNHLTVVKEAIQQTGLFKSEGRRLKKASKSSIQQTGRFRRLDSTEATKTAQSERKDQVELIHPLFTETLAVNFWESANQEKKEELLGGMKLQNLKRQGLFLIDNYKQSCIVITHGRINFVVKTNDSVANSTCETTSDVSILARDSTFKKSVLFTEQGLNNILDTRSPLSLEKATDSLTLCKQEEIFLVVFFLNVYFFLCHIFSGVHETDKLYALKKYMYIYVLLILSPIMVCNVRRCYDCKAIILASVLLATVFRFLNPIIVYIILKPSWPDMCFSNSTYFQYFIIDFICVGGYLLLLSYRFVFPLIFMLKENCVNVSTLILKVAIQVSTRQLMFFRLITTYYVLVLFSNRLVMERKYSDCKMILDAIGAAVHLIHLIILEIVSFVQYKSVLASNMHNRAVQKKGACKPSSATRNRNQRSQP